MKDSAEAIARNCLDGAENDTMTFPQIVGTLIEHGFEGYAIDFRRENATYYQTDGSSFTLPIHAAGLVAAAFDTHAIHSAVREAQALAPGYTYAGFCDKIAAAGCAGYMVSFFGRRAVYYGRTAETLVEEFPK